MAIRPADQVRQRRVALVCMPFQAPSWPSLALAVLSSVLREKGHRVDLHYLNLDAARRIGVGTYTRIANQDSVDMMWPRMVGEWLYADPRVARGAASPRAFRAFLDSCRDPRQTDGLKRLDLTAIRTQLDGLLDEWVRGHDWAGYDVVGFTVGTQQLNASLRLGRLIKETWPRVRVVLGGPTLMTPMGAPILERHEWLDAVFSGYAEETFPLWLDDLPPRGAQPVVHEGPGAHLDSVPIPNFDDFFAAFERSGIAAFIAPTVPIETSRGCWWSDTKRCTFCGLNDDDPYRHKTAERTLEEVRRLASYGLPIYASDNIMPLAYFAELFPRMEREGVRFPSGTFYSVKSSIKPDQLQQLARLGVKEILTGIESLSPSVLETMRKGTSALQNIWLLRAVEELNMRAQWFWLYGCPGEQPEAYAEVAPLLPHLSHLPAPNGVIPVQMPRGSPLHATPHAYGVSQVSAAPAYALAFGAFEGLDRHAFFFDYRFDDGREPRVYAEPVITQVRRWMEIRLQPLAPRCEVLTIAGQRILVDSRRRGQLGRGPARIRRVSDAEWRVLEELATPKRVESIRKMWANEPDLLWNLDRMEEHGLVLELEGRWLRLVIVRDDPRPSAELRRVLSIKGRSLVTRAKRSAVSWLPRSSGIDVGPRGLPTNRGGTRNNPT